MRRPAYGQENCAHIEESVHTKKSMHTGLYIDCVSLWLFDEPRKTISESFLCMSNNSTFYF